MSAIYEKVTLKWKGKEYEVQPSFNMVQAIESTGISIIGVSNKMARGEPPLSQVSIILAHMLRSGGARTVSPEEVYEHLFFVKPDELEHISNAIVTAFTPTRLKVSKEPDSGNSTTPKDGT